MKTLIAAALATAVHFAAVAAEAPDARATRLIVPLPAGTTADVVARIVAKPLSQALGTPVVVDNRAGADGAIGAELAARSPADGHTLLFAGNTPMLGVPTLRKKPPYDPLADFAPIASMVRFAFFLVVHPSVPASTLPELVAYARAHPGRLNYASGNINGVLAAAQLMAAAGVEMVHVPYKGEPQAVPDLLDGRVHVMFATGGIAAPLVKERRLRALATLLPERSALLPEVPTAAEAGMPQLSVVIWAGLFAPARTPKDTVERLSAEVNAILGSAPIREQLARHGVEAAGSAPAEFAGFLRQQLIDWGNAARQAGIRPE